MTAGEVTIIPLFRLVDDLGLTDTHWPLIVVPVFGAPSVLALTQYVDVYGGHLWNVQLAAATTTVVPVLVVFVVAQRQFVEGLAQSGLKG
ncbi:hypothetical protein Q5425_08425 [Amycolatopsis sp. A133]|uniref:hypothetical protein n=1 Tax=Amycolatopsis sp. A133 TaxID=3064472 RepID=UPI0027E9D51E|nr:hypothetical protein [Amycolatopsis sp. A133]MDQ7803755.1 hypothetical protein [Amycolatopsis sp. A133]